MLEHLQERLDRALLSRSEPPGHDLAREQLARAGIRFLRILAVRSEAIIYLSPGSTVITAWSEVRPSGSVVFYCETGMPAWPAEKQ